MKKQLPIGYSNFKDIIEGGYYYVDKSLFIKDVIDSGLVTLITRPRRFGKTLNLSMLRYFYDLRGDNDHLFKELAIWKENNKYTSKLGQFPVIHLTFKDVKNRTWADAYEALSGLLRHLVVQDFAYLHKWEGLNPLEKEQLHAIWQGQATRIQYSSILKTLSTILDRYHSKKVVILIDEYDTPVRASYLNGYYEDMIEFVRDLMSGGMKDNDHLEKAVITGILRVAKESIFSGLNNLDVYPITGRQMTKHFGFSEAEVKQLIRAMELDSTYMEAIHDWYNGYTFGEDLLYNPWSIIMYSNQSEDGFQPYWVNTSDNTLLKQLLLTGDANIKTELNRLINGQKLRKKIKQSLVFSELDYSKQAVWSLLLFSGYLKAENMRQEQENRSYELSIPNREVMFVYKQFISQWIEQQVGDEAIPQMLSALIAGQIKPFQHFLKQFVIRVFSYMDTQGSEPESFYHAFILGLLVNLESRYHIRSNRESGFGRYDILLIPKSPHDKGIVIELKSPFLEDKQSLEDALAEAIVQLKTKKYSLELSSQGISDILQLAIAVQGKEVMIQEV